MLKDVSSYDALEPATYKAWKGKYSYCISSLPFDMLDIMIPLALSTFDLCIFHVPSWYVTDANNPRHSWLASLACDGRCVALSVTYARNKALGRYCMWVVFGKSKKDILHYLDLTKHKSVLQLYL